MHVKELARQTELEQEVQRLRVAQAATVQRPAAAVAAPAASLPTDPDAIQVLINELAGVVESCDDPGSKEEATKFREAAVGNKSFLAILFNAIHIKQAAAERAPVAPGAVGDQGNVANARADEGMVRAPKRSAEEAQLPERPQPLQQAVPEQQQPAPAISMSRDALVASLGLSAADAVRKLEVDDKAGNL